MKNIQLLQAWMRVHQQKMPCPAMPKTSHKILCQVLECTNCRTLKQNYSAVIQWTVETLVPFITFRASRTGQCQRISQDGCASRNPYSQILFQMKSILAFTHGKKKSRLVSRSAPRIRPKQLGHDYSQGDRAIKVEERL